MAKKKKPASGQHPAANIFDDVFRTIAEKFPQLFIGLINEVFHTDYPEDVPCRKLKNEHYTKNGKIVTDALLEIRSHMYHIECQSRKDGRMEIRMFEYDVSIAMEHAVDTGHGMEMEFPESCVVYIRNHRTVPDHHDLVVRFPNGQRVCYQVPVLKASDYTVSDLFRKKLVALIPYYILRYESFLKSNSTDKKKTEQLLADMRLVSENLRECYKDNESMYVDITNLTLEICNYIIPDSNGVKRKVGDVMGGKVLELQSEILIKQGERRGIQKGIEKGIQKGIDKKTIEVYKNCIANGMGKDAAVMISGITPELLELYERTTT